MNYRTEAIILSLLLPALLSAASLPRVDTEVRRHLPHGKEAVMVSRGDFGTAENGAVVIYQEEGCAECRYAGMALVAEKGGAYRAVAFPDIRQFDNLTVDNRGVGQALYADIDFDGQKEVLIPVKGYRKGPEGYPLMVVAVMDWNGKAFVRIEKAELFFGDTCSNAVEVKAMLHLLVTCSGTYVSETPGISADLTVALAANGELTGIWNAVYGRAHMCDRLTVALRQGNGRIELVKTGIASGADEVIAAMQVTGKKAVIRFLKDPGEFDCGAGHPPVVKLRRK
ncbi:MAG TPA: hypothetical protein PLM53_05975 [Spirochaetota bacterium]|nr:hypothetical protein [Spirochaetota bacterium]HPC43253.1 hypothetical protein [Spirochaetota bacterium]HQF10531.1 hypothetical protein [Spirochaetota bacterium]HQH96629.1 hypothetical protein [Spirochaetota bacterium]HQJ69801.1 hypothetical protein [Spirochaetota bacterium]